MSSDAGSSDSSATSPVVDPSRPVEKIDEGLLQFTHQEDGEQRPHCLASGWIVQGGQKKPEYHLTHSTETKKLIGKCSRLLNQLVCNINDTEISYGDCCGIMERGFESSGSSPAVPNESKNASSEKLPPKRRRVNDGSEGSIGASVTGYCVRGDAISLEQMPLKEDNPIKIVGSMVTKNFELIQQTVATHDAPREICCQAISIIVELQFVSCRHPFDSKSALGFISKLEANNLKLASHSNDLPLCFRKNLSQFIELTFKFRRLCLRSFSAGAVERGIPPLSKFSSGIVKVNIEMNAMIHNLCESVELSDTTKAKISDICRSQNTEIMKFFNVCHEAKVSTSSVMELVRSISNANKRFVPLLDSLPKELILKLIDMYEVVSSFLMEEVASIGP